ncbi:MAG: hypothetical protein ACYCTZ_16015 [Candidatus Dormibacteria bacterium]
MRQLLAVVLPRVQWDLATALGWLRDQHRRKAAASASHRRRWLRDHPIQPAL